MSLENCVLKAKAWAKENSDVELSPQEIDRIGALLSDAERLGATPAEKNRLMQDFVEQKLANSQAKERATRYMNALKNEQTVAQTRININSFIEQGVDKNQAPIEARKAFLAGGSTRPGVGTNLDPQYMAATTRARYLNFLENSMESSTLKVFKSTPMNSKMTSDIIQELYALRKGLQLGQSKNELALEMAKSIRETQDYTLKEFQSVNPYAGENPDYLFSRLHDRTKISATPVDEWVRDARQAFAPSFLGKSAAEIQSMLRDTYSDIKSGLYGDNFDPRRFWQPKGTSGNQGQAVSGSRNFTATDWKAEVAYAQKYGANSLYESTYDQINRVARNTARFQKMGLNIAENYEAQNASIYRSLDSDQREAWVKAEPEMKKLFASTMGSQDNEAWGLRARRAQGLLVAQDLSMMGMHTPRALNGIQAGITLARDGLGTSLPENAFQITSGMAKAILEKGGGREALKAMGVAFRDMAQDANGDLAGGSRDFSLPARAAQLMGKLSLANREASAMKAALCRFTTRELGNQAALPFDQLPYQTQLRLNRADLGGKNWEVMRQSVGGVGDGWDGHILPEHVLGLSDEQVAPLMGAQGPREATRVRTEMAMKYGALLNEEAGLMVGESNSSARYTAYGDTNLNTGWGIARRFMMQFRTAAMMRRQLLVRTMQAGGAESGNASGVLQHMIGTAFLGAVGEGLVAAATGKSGPVPDQLVGHMVNSTGLLGVYGSIIASMLETPRSNPTDMVKNAAVSAVGPAFKTLAQGGAAAAKTGLGVYQALQGEEKPGQYGGKYWASLIHSLTPGQNLFYTKAAVDYLFMNQLHEFMGGGGYLEMLRQSMAKHPGWPESLGGTGEKQHYTFGGKSFWE